MPAASITTLQMDIKVSGIPTAVMRKRSSRRAGAHASSPR